MNSPGFSDVGGVLQAPEPGATQTIDQLLPVVYSELKRIARHHLRASPPRPTLCTTELVHEAFMKVAGGAKLDGKGRAYFFAAASRAMRQVLVDFARRRRAAKRGGQWSRITLADEHATIQVRLDEVLALDQALDRLGVIDARLRQIVEYRFFGGLSEEEIAQLLGVSTRTVERNWLKAKLLLLRELQPESS